SSGSNGRYIYASASLKEGSWMLIYRQDFKDAYFDLNRSKKVAIWIIIVGSIAIISMALLISNKIVNRFSRIDREKEMMNQQVIETGKLASIGELAAGIAHEINNPVAIMVEEAGWIQDLLEEEDFSKGKNLQEFERSLNQIRSQGRRCKEITHKLLSFARKTDSQVQNIQINSVVEEIIELTTQMAKYNNVIIQKHLQQELPSIKISPSEMQQVLLNLINNAIDAMAKSGGKIIIHTKLKKAEKDYIVISVEDNGPGIPPANLSRVFDPFFTTKPVGKGTGLGLSICYGIIQKMGGSIDVVSGIDVGTTFSLRIPVSEKD
ncbi:MAG: ATP-binding protein, partial [Desulfobacterales bacterium]|nr:ATP-binding protein [Desulfobacterales bacterium]